MISWNERRGLLTGSAEEKETAFVNELMRYVAGESKALVERNESNPPPSLLDSFSDKLAGEDEVKRRVLAIEKRFLWSSLVLLRIDCIFSAKREFDLMTSEYPNLLVLKFDAEFEPKMREAILKPSPSPPGFFFFISNLHINPWCFMFYVNWPLYFFLFSFVNFCALADLFKGN